MVGPSRLRRGGFQKSRSALLQQRQPTMKQYRNVPKLEDFEVYSPSAAALARARARTYESAETLSRGERIASWMCRAIAAAIMIETLFFKFTGAPESVYIFSKMG